MRKKCPHFLLPILAVAVSMLTACASGGPRTLAPKLTVPEHLKAIRDSPPLPQPKSAGPADLLENHIAVARAYHQCRDTHRALTDWLEATGD